MKHADGHICTFSTFFRLTCFFSSPLTRWPNLSLTASGGAQIGSPPHPHPQPLVKILIKQPNKAPLAKIFAHLLHFQSVVHLQFHIHKITQFVPGSALQEAHHPEDIFPERWPAGGGVWLGGHGWGGDQDHQGQDRHEVRRWVLRHLWGHEQFRCVQGCADSGVCTKGQ